MFSLLNQPKITHLLWTGGWDSTYRLIELLLTEKKTVLPHYIIGEERRSFPIELAAMASVREEIAKRYPEDSDRLLPTRYFNKSEIEKMPGLTRASDRLRSKMSMDPQYEWISRYCRQHNIHKVNLCIISHSPDHASDVFISMLRLLNNTGNVPGKKLVMTDLAELFHPFELPYLNLTKRDLLEQAKQNGWMGLMKLTWFCYNPKPSLKNGYKPCGGCVTCRGQYKHNFQWRIPIRRRLLQRAYRFKKRLFRQN